MENNTNSNNETKKLSNLNGSCNLSIDQCDMTSLEILNKCHLDIFPKKKTICDDVDCMRIVEQLPILNGEYIQFIGPSGKQNEEILLVTNFRLFLLMHDSTSFINVPLMLIESIEIKEIFYIYIYLKNVKSLRITFCSNEKTSIWYQRLNSILIKPYKLEELFAFTFYSWLTNEKSDETQCFFSKNDSTVNIIYKEFKRLKFDSKLWRITDINKKFELCPTYPEIVIVPRCMNDEQLKKIANFRSSKRFPAVVWRSKINGAVLARSSQPNVGLLAWRLNEDELLIRAIADCCSITNTNNNNNNLNNNNNKISDQIDSNSSSQNKTVSLVTSNTLSLTNESLKSTSTTTASGVSSPITSQISEQASSVLLIIDARFRSVALANRVKGGGYEYSEYYTNCEIQFMNLENIHVIRSSFQALRLLCQTVTDNKLFYSQLESTKWLHHLSGIIKAACTVINSIDRQAKPVLIHCSDGWDRTPQILALAKLLLDPYYRTISGFRTLVELEWLMFGHKFSQRNGHSASNNDINERCPVFLQWLDCVYQIQRQFPWAFEFNETFLLKLCFHSYSCLFGTFLCDSAVERVNEHIDERTFSVWSYLNDKNKEMVNYLYDDSFDEVLYPMCELVNMQVWQKLFCESEIAYLVQVANKHEMQNFNDSTSESQNTGSILIDAGSLNNINGSSPQIDYDLEMESDLKQLNKDLANNKSSNLINNNNNNKKSILEKRVIFNKSTQNQNNVLHKTRSYEDMSKSFIKQNFIKQNEIDNIKEISCFHNENENINNGAGVGLENLNGDPIHVRSCSESNLLFDALQNISSTSPKFTNTIETKLHQFNLNGKNENLIIENKLTPELITFSNGNNNHAFDKTKNNDENKNSNLEEINLIDCSPSEIATNNISNIEGKIEPFLEPVSTSCVNSVLMQKSTDTLVDEAHLVNKLAILNGNSVQSTVSEDTFEEDDLFDVNNKNSINIRMNSRQANNGPLVLIAQKTALSQNSSTPLSSSITISPASLTIHNNLKKSFYNNGINSVSTSTSGLSDYVTSAKFRMINDTIKYFEKSFNEENNNGTNNNNINDENIQSKEDGYLAMKRQTSNSIPIAKKNSDDKKIKKNKKIQDCIDVDGLTKIIDPTCLKVMERDEQYRKEIASLKEQVNKCKTFLNSLTNTNLWQESSINFSKNDLMEKSHCEENQSNSYSFSNDSVCSSSWDEIDESDYRLATWVPDYCISHCQNCNSKFSYRLRKHHCRNCGQVFCYKCADQFYPLPNHNLTAPVRVCFNCKLTIEQKQNTNGGHLTIFNNNHNNQINEQKLHSFLANPIRSESFSNIKANNQQQDFIKQKFSYSPSNFNNHSFTNGLFSSNQQNTFSSKPLQNLTSTTASSCNIGSRCNQLDSNKFKKNGPKTQKVSV